MSSSYEETVTMTTRIKGKLLRGMAYTFRDLVHDHHGVARWRANRCGAGAGPNLQLDLQATGSELRSWAFPNYRTPGSLGL